MEGNGMLEGGQPEGLEAIQNEETPEGVGEIEGGGSLETPEDRHLGGEEEGAQSNNSFI